MRLSFLIILLFITTNVVAQREYVPMIKPGRVWVTENDFSTARNVIEVTNDTIINGEQWYVLVAYPENNPQDCQRRLTRECERKVYMRGIEKDADEQDERIVLDFSLSTGDVVNMGGNYSVEKGVEVIRGIRRDVLWFLDYAYSVEQVWMEGVGIVNNKTLIDTDVPMFLENGTRLIACYQDDECLYYDNTTKIDASLSSKVVTNKNIYDITGRKVTGTASKGIRIRGEKKFFYK